MRQANLSSIMTLKQVVVTVAGDTRFQFHLVQPFIILMMIHWNFCQAVMNCLNPITPNTLDLGVKSRGLELKLSPQVIHKFECGSHQIPV